MRGSRTAASLAFAIVFAVAFAGPVLAQDIASFEKKITERRLDNGLTILICERHVAPVASFITYVNVGAAQEVPGITGIAHMFEHMAFKGTTKVGTNDWPSEKRALDEIDKAYHAYDDERRKVGGPDPKKLADLEKAWKDAQEAADKFIVKNEFDDILSRAGAVGVNAGTGSDSTVYFCALPANKTELWAYLDSSRFLDPVFREFYKERDVVHEERRLRTDSQPTGRLSEQFHEAAFVAHPYHQPVVGYASDLLSFSREDAERFRKTYYVPSNMVVSIAGDVNAAQLMPVLEKYFGRLPAAPPPPAVRTEEPAQNAERTVSVPDASQPVYMEGYHKGAATDPDEPVFSAISDVLSNGRTSRLYRSLVRDKKIAVAVNAGDGNPGDKYPNLFGFFAIPAPGHTNEEVAKAIHDEIARMQTDPITDDELKMVKTRAKAGLIRRLASNTGIAIQLAEAKTLYGDWRHLFREVDEIDKVSKDDIQRVAKATFIPTNRTVAMIVHTEGAGGPEGAPGTRPGRPRGTRPDGAGGGAPGGRSGSTGGESPGGAPGARYSSAGGERPESIAEASPAGASPEMTRGGGR